MSVLVLGATGFVGARLVHHLGDRAVPASRSPRPTGRLAGWDGPWVAVDPTDGRRLAALVHRIGVDAVVHAAVDRDRELAARRPTAVRLAEAAGRATAEAGVPLVALGSGAEYGDVPVPHREESPLRPTTPHGRAKAAASRVLLQWGTGGSPVSVLRPFHVTGIGEPTTKLLPRALAAAAGGPPLPVVPGAPVRDVVAVDDVVAAVLAALDRPVPDGRPVNLCSGVGVTVAEVVAAVERATGRPVPTAGTHPRTVLDEDDRVGDPARAARLWGWRARPLDDVVAEAWRAWPW